MIQKKICMVGMFGTGKTSLVRQFVFSKYAEKYHSTVGVKVDKKQVDVQGTALNLLLWDIEGSTQTEQLKTTYLRGAAGLLFVADGTRLETFDHLFELRNIAQETLGPVPSIVALNKHDLATEWVLQQAHYDMLANANWHTFMTSAKTGEGVENAFYQLGSQVLAPSG